MALSGGDLAEIQQLYAAYNHAVDTGDAASFVRCFAPDGSLAGGGPAPVQGPDALGAFAESVPAGVPGIRHFAGNVLVEGEGDDATGQAYLIVYVTGAPPQLLITGRYRDALKRLDGRWVFQTRHFAMDTPA